ncbi:MAG: DNA-binding protein [Tissierellia bacterium]|nr:DNA-binding protein [Tissierellia bacterium]
MVKKLVEIGILFDFYGKLLSERQYTSIELYYIHDLSLTEIGEELNISRQGVYDTLKRAEQKLYEYEDTLGLINKFNYKIREIDKIDKITKEIEKESQNINNQKILEKSKALREIVEKIKDSGQEVGD